jgi:hypothetical protein
MVAHIHWRHFVHSSLRCFLQQRVELYLEVLECVGSVGFSLSVLDRWSLLITAFDDFPMLVLFWSILLHIKAYLLSHFVLVTAAWLVDTVMSIQTQVFTLTLCPTSTYVYFRLFPDLDVRTCRWVSLKPCIRIALVRGAFVLASEWLETSFI